jgi:N-acylneuraminate cytidylyltransferase
MRKICIIPARGGSKRIPRKNIKKFLGQPIISYSIEAALKSKLFDVVMVSTDDLEIAEIAKKYGALVPFLRSEKNSNDYATTYDVIEEVLENYSKEGEKFDFGCCIYSCAPFVNALKLEESYKVLVDKKYECVFPIISFGFPIQRALKIDNTHKVSFFQPDYALTRSQDLEKSYHDAGQFYWFNVKKCLESKSIITNNSGSIIISELDGQDIDTEIDWSLAELKYEIQKKSVHE